MNYTCRICFSIAEHPTYCCREKMFGWADEFAYFQCVDCGCLQIADVPVDLSRFYPPNYYSFHIKPFPQTGWKSRLAGWRDHSAATGFGLFGKWLGRFQPANPDVASLAAVPARRNMRIIDVGCGRGRLLSILHRAGFNHLVGADPFLPEDIEVLPGLQVRKLSLEQIQDKFDLIMLHHVFEHIESGGQMLQACREHLKPQGKILLCFPTADSDAWEQYRENWVQLDAPRHLFLHTRTSFKLLAEKSGLKIEKWVCDSSAFQFWGSELYRKNLPLWDANGIEIKPESHFSKIEMKVFAERARKVNATQRGDQVVVVLGRATV
jgi:SAM-dependent methyltransferase